MGPERSGQRRATEGERIVDVGTFGWLDRYHAGKHTEVWHEFRQIGAAIHEPGVVEEAELVCDQMALRARQNIETIVTRLVEQGYRFHTNDYDQTPVEPHLPPSQDAPSVAAWLQARFDKVPLTLLSWVRLVGDVWLVGTHPLWTASASADPLVIEIEGSRYSDASIKDYFDAEHRAHERYARERPEDVGLFVLPVAPDCLHKDNVSGGAPYGIIVPDGCADGLFVAETPMPFVTYLNRVFGSGGFPGSGNAMAPWGLRQSLAKDLLPL
jgi:hypothetical protein